MPAKLSIGSWAYAFGPYQDNPVPFDKVVRTLGEYGYDGIEIGAFKPHVHPDDYPMRADREKLKNLIKANNLEISGLAADFWAYPGPGTDEAQKKRLLYQNLQKKYPTLPRFRLTRHPSGYRQWAGWDSRSR